MEGTHGDCGVISAAALVHRENRLSCKASTPGFKSWRRLQFHWQNRQNSACGSGAVRYRYPSLPLWPPLGLLRYRKPAYAISGALGGPDTTVLLGESATEHTLKQQPLGDYRVIHFAAHGIVSTKYPARSALVLLPGGGEDGLLQAREILNLRLRAALVTLSACDTGAGDVYGQEGVASLARPFLAAGARTVVASLWSTDDTFSLAIMREFYGQLAAGADKGEALRKEAGHAEAIRATGRSEALERAAHVW
jgi:hypothetical protein